MDLLRRVWHLPATGINPIVVVGPQNRTDKEMTMTTELNGWNVEEMKEAVEGIRQEPDAGHLTWRTSVTWDGGFGLDVRTCEIQQLDQSMERHFTLRGDHPPELLGHNTGPTAVEALLAALGACITGTFAAQATARGVQIDSMEADLEGAIDLNGFFGLQPIRPGLSDVKVTLRVGSDAEPEVLQEILDAARSLSPVFDSVTRPVGVESSVTKM
jgi:uncharacterized OsmC-like protein